MGTILLCFLAIMAVILFQVTFTLMDASPYKKKYHELLFVLSKNPNDTELKLKAIESGNKYYSKIKAYGMGSNRGAITSARSMNLIGEINEKELYEDMNRVVNSNKK